MIDEEILIKVMEEYVPKTSRYVSCIRINGKPILPPLINDEYRKVLLHYKKLALLVEKKLKDKNILCDNRQSIDSGIITNTMSERSWLNNCVLPLENITTSYSGGNKCAVNCKSNIVSQSEPSENTSSKTLICDDDMWRYLSKCSSENYNPQIDISEDDQISDISQKFETCYDVAHDQLSKSVSKLTNNFALEKSHEPIQQSTIHELRGENVLLECNTGNIFQNDSNNVNMCQNANLIEPCEGNIFSSYSENDNMKEICAFNSENNLCRIYANDKVISNDVKNSVDVAIEESIPCICDGSSKVDEKKSSKINVDIKCDVHKDECVMSDKAISELTTSGIEGCNLGRNDSKSSRETEDFSNPCELTNFTPAGSETNCLKSSLGYPICLADGDKKIEKYNPLKYSSEGIPMEVSYTCISPAHTYVPSAENDNLSSGEIEGLESDSTFAESYGINVPEHFISLDYSSASQKIIKEIPLSESVSISEIDYQTCSAVTVSQDSPGESSELCNELSVNKTYDRDGPKLVRQNSYTLIAPSPILLAHVKAAEKVEDGGISEDDNCGSQKSKVGRKSWDIGKGKTDWDLGKTGKYVYAVPLKNTPDYNRAVVSPSDEVRSHKYKVYSLPGSSVVSPVKINPYFSSVDNLPMVNVRKFHEFISSKANFHQLSHAVREPELADKKLHNCHSFVDVACDKNVDSGKAILINCNMDDSEMLEIKRKILSKPKEESVIPNQVNVDGFSNLEETYKSTSFSQSTTSYLLGNSETNDEGSPDNSNKYIQPSSVDRTNPHCNYHTKTEQGHLPVQNSSTNCLTACDSTVQSVFLQLQNQHSLLMAQLLDRQKKEQEILANTFLTQQRQILREMKLIPADSLELEHSNSNLDDESLSVNGSKNSPHNLSETPSVEFVSRHSQSFRWEPRNVDGYSLRENEVKEQFLNRIEDSKYSTCNYEKRDLINFSTLQQKKNSNYSEEHKKAVTVINAYVRGYLVRRLLKTEHVQEIIKTISESVMCALQLQRECPVDITPSDVELHRRLIQQLTAACHSLHETFFSVTLQERMNIIATDREKRSSQLSRPVSAKSTITAATQKYLQRKQQLRSSRQLERPVSSTRRSWWRSKGRVSSAGNYDQPSSCFSKQPNGISSKQQQCNNRSTRRPWR